MEINLTWDLFIIVFFTVIIAYTFIIGRNQCIKIIISAYISILAADGIGNLLDRYFIGSKAVFKSEMLMDNESMLTLVKILIFIIGTVMITTRGRFNINIGRTNTLTMRIVLGLAYGIFSAGLIVSTLLIYASGTSLIQGSTTIMNDAILAIYRQSQLVRLMINNYNVWFALPAIAFVISSFIGEEEE